MKKGVREVDPALLLDTSIGYSLVGSWDGFDSAIAMAWDGSGYTTIVKIGENSCTSFQLLLEGDRNSVFHPDVPDASPEVRHYVCGPSSRTPLGWLIGRDPEDAQSIAAGCKNFQVKVYLAEGIPAAVEWWAMPGVSEEGGREGMESQE